MSALTHLGLIDLTFVAVVAFAILAAVKRRSGIISSLASGAITAATCWILAGVAIVWGPAALSSAISGSALAHAVPPPVHALSQVGQFFGHSGASA